MAQRVRDPEANSPQYLAVSGQVDTATKYLVDYIERYAGNGKRARI